MVVRSAYMIMSARWRKLISTDVALQSPMPLSEQSMCMASRSDAAASLAAETRPLLKAATSSRMNPALGELGLGLGLGLVLGSGFRVRVRV